MTSGKNLTSTGSESHLRVHTNNLLLCNDILVTRDSQWQKLTYRSPSKTQHVSDVDVSYNHYVPLSQVAH